MDRKANILVVDDERETTKTLEGLLYALGYNMYTAYNGEEALKMIEALALDVILLDVRMPRIDGIEVLKRVRKEKGHIKVIIITSYDKEVKKTVEDIGVDGFFAKPIDFSKLVDRVKALIETSGSSTRVFPTKDDKKDEFKVTSMPKARILFVEPNEMIFAFTCAFFCNKDTVKGHYEIKVAYGAIEGMDLLYKHSPDIVIMYESLFSLEDTKSFARYMLASTSHRPRMLILHGLTPKSSIELHELDQIGIKYCYQNYITEENFKRVNSTLVDFVGKLCVADGLIENKDEDNE